MTIPNLATIFPPDQLPYVVVALVTGCLIFSGFILWIASGISDQPPQEELDTRSVASRVFDGKKPTKG